MISNAGTGTNEKAVDNSTQLAADRTRLAFDRTLPLLREVDDIDYREVSWESRPSSVSNSKMMCENAAMSAISRLAALLAGSARTVVFTGAGISTESGIPDFRSPGGVWSRMKPIDFDTFMHNEDARREAWQRTFSGKAGWVGAKPNEGHFAIARLVETGKVGHVITQNVDNLHQDAGVPADQVIELHGNAGYATCLICGLRHDLADLRDSFLEQGTLPACRACGGIVKSATISFGQPMPVEAMRRAEAASRDCDLFIVLGSSLLVYPAASLPMVAKSNGAALAIINREPTDIDGRADVVIHAEIGAVLREIVQ